VSEIFKFKDSKFQKFITPERFEYVRASKTEKLRNFKGNPNFKLEVPISTKEARKVRNQVRVDALMFGKLVQVARF
jgi:hypothetical protein